jgi:YVTN family beta-propeller protein
MRLRNRRVPSLAAAAGLLLAAQLSAATLIVGNKAEATASLIDLGTGKVVATLPTGEGPHEVAVSPDGRWALVANYGTRERPGATLTVIDVPAARVARTVDLGEHRRPHGVEWLDGGRALVTAEAGKALLEVDVAAGKVLRAISTGQEVSHMVAATPGGKRAFVANIGSGSMTAIDLAAGKKLADVATGAGAEGIAVTPDGRHVWVTNREAGTLTAVDASTLEVVATVECPGFPIRAKVTPDGKHVLVSNARNGDVAVVSTADRRLERRVAMGIEAATTEGRLLGAFGASPVPIGIVIAPDGRRAWIANSNADKIAVLDLEAWKVTGHLAAGKEPDGMAYSALDAKPADRPAP